MILLRTHLPRASVPRGIPGIFSSLQKPGFRAMVRLGGDGLGSFGAKKPAIIALSTRMIRIISPKTADLLYLNLLKR
jgi:hypothetical protein